MTIKRLTTWLVILCMLFTITPTYSVLASSNTPQIVGDADFIQKTNAALNLIKQYSPTGYENLTDYIFSIQQQPNARFWSAEQPSAFYVSNDVAKSSTVWYAGVMICYAYHAKTYYSLAAVSNINGSTYPEEVMEVMCLEFQINFVQKAGGTTKQLEQLKAYRDGDWWDTPSVSLSSPTTATTAPTNSYLKPLSNLSDVKIEGDKDFVEITKHALSIINESTNDSNLVKKYLGVIRQGNVSNIYVNSSPPMFVVGYETYNSELYWYASAIIHEAYHSKQYNDYRDKNGSVPNSIYAGQTAEMEALEQQILFLKQVNAPETTIEYAESLRGTKWWGNPERWW